MVNVPELERVLAYCRDNPDKHDQSNWICGTTACFAGHAALLNGWKPVLATVWDGTVWDGSTAYVTKDDQGNRSLPIVAAGILGLDDDQAHNLFITCQTFDALELAVKDIINEASG